MANAKFSLNLEALSNDALTLMNSQSTTIGGGTGNNVSSTYQEDGSDRSFGGSISSTYQGGEPEELSGGLSEVSLPTTSINGIFVDDKESQLCVLKFNVFSAFPVEYGNGSCTMCLDRFADDYIRKGFLSSGHNSMPETYSLLDTISVKLFKVGCAVNHKQGDEYLGEFYPDGEWNTGDFKTLANKLFVTAEIIVPISATSGKNILCKVVHDSDYKNEIEVMGAFCSLNQFEDIFKVEGLIDGNATKWNEQNAKFICADGQYNHITGEIDNYGPESVKSKIAR